MSVPTVYPGEINVSEGPTDSLPRYTTTESVLTPQSGNVITGKNKVTTTGSAQKIFDIPMTALGFSLFNSPHLLLNLETAQDTSAGTPIGFAFAVTSSDLSNATAFSRDYLTETSPLYMTTSTSFGLSRETDYPVGTSNLAVYVVASADPSANMPSTSTLAFSYALSSVQ